MTRVTSRGRWLGRAMERRRSAEAGAVGARADAVRVVKEEVMAKRVAGEAEEEEEAGARVARDAQYTSTPLSHLHALSHLHTLQYPPYRSVVAWRVQLMSRAAARPSLRLSRTRDASSTLSSRAATRTYLHISLLLGDPSPKAIG